MTLRFRRTDSYDDQESPASPIRTLMSWLPQTASLVYLAGGFFLIYQYWAHLDRRILLMTGILFVLYGAYRFYLVRRSAPRGRRRVR